MTLEGLGLGLPSLVVSNDDVIDLLSRTSAAGFTGNLAELKERLRRMLDMAGAERRHWLAPGDKPLDLLIQASEEAISNAKCTRTDIDCVIYAGTDRGFLEPAAAYFAAAALGMTSVQCFDVLDACNGWARALQLCEGLLETGQADRILILNPEFNMFSGGAISPQNFGWRDPSDADTLFASLTIGEAATATVVSRGQQKWTWLRKSRPDLANLSHVLLPGFERYVPDGFPIKDPCLGRFVAEGGSMFVEGERELLDLVDKSALDMDEIDIIIPHTASRTAWQRAAERLNVAEKMFHSFHEYGNIASASLPAGMLRAIGQGRLKRGDRVLLLSASAGMTFCISAFEF